MKRKTVKPPNPSPPVVDLSGYVCSNTPDETDSSSNKQTGIIDNGTITTELGQSKLIHGARHKLTDCVVEFNRLNSET